MGWEMNRGGVVNEKRMEWIGEDERGRMWFGREDGG